ncbi:MAG: SDR family oxidoreductase [Polyangiaceae bacterium]
MKLNDKSALITGGTSGIGLCVAQLFAQAGARVTLSGSSAESARRATQTLGAAARVCVSDAADPRCVQALIDDVVASDGGIDVLFLNAGRPALAPLAVMDEATFDAQIALHLKGPWFALRAATPHLRRGASVILNTSVANVSGAAGLGAYAAAKAGLRSLGRCAARELLGAGVRVNAVSPGPIDTEIVEKMGLPEPTRQYVREQLLASVPMGRFGSAREVAEVVLFLASDASSFMTGTELVVDGGATQL